MRPAPLDRKVLRDLSRLKWQVAAIALLIACGVSVAVMAFSAQRALEQAQTRFYAETRFAEAFVTAKRAPLSLAPRLGAIPGVTAVDVRILQSGLMQVPGIQRPAVARIVSLPADDRFALNRLRISRGRLPEPDSSDEVVALQSFLEAAHLQLGDRLTAVIGGRAFSFRITGAAVSPEYVYVPAPESFMPDDAHQAVLWAPRRTLERVAGMTGAFNTAAVSVAPGASMGLVLQRLDQILGPYGGRAAYARADQTSHAFLAAELRELSTSAAILPPVFLLVAAGLVHLVVSRLVEAEREQIGLVKAFGYGDWSAAGPYLRLAAVIGLSGAAAGGVIGAMFGATIVDQYRRYFRFPVLEPGFHWPAFGAAAAIAVAAALAGSLLAARRAAALSPAVAMQPPQPTAYRRGPLDRWLLGRGLDEATRTILRQLQRFPLRAVFAAAGLAASLALLVGTQFLFDSVEAVVDQTYFEVQRWTESVSLHEARTVRATAEAARLPGVTQAEPVRVVAARLSNTGRARLSRIVGLSPGTSLEHPLDGRGRRVPLQGDGLVLSEALAGRLGVKPGGAVWVQVVEGSGPQARLRVSGLSRDYSGFAAYMDRRALNRLMGEGDLANGARMLVASDQRPAFYRALEARPLIAGASSRDETVAAWRRTMAEAFQVTITVYVGFAGAIAFGVAYNMGRISLSERSRDLATLHVLGFGHWECAYILTGELALIALAAAPVGLAAGWGLAQALAAAYSRDDLRLPSLVSARSYGIGLAAYFAAVALGAVLVARRIWTLDIVAALKTRE